MRASAFIIAAALALPPITLSFPAAAAVADGAQEEADRDQQVVCRRGYATTSRMGSSSRECRTRAEWRAMSRVRNRNAGDESHSGTTRANNPGSASQPIEE